MNRINEKINALVESIQRQLTASKNKIYAVATCKKHEVSLNNINVIAVACETCPKTNNITSRSLPKVVNAASQVSKELQLTMKDKAMANDGDITKGRMLSVRKTDDGNTVCIVVLDHLITKDEVEVLRTIHPYFTVSFTPVHMTKHAGEKTRTIQNLKTAKKKENAQPMVTC